MRAYLIGSVRHLEFGVGSLENFGPYLTAFKKGLNEGGFVEGQNVAIEYRWADGQYERMEKLAADLVGRRVAAIAVPGSPPGARAAKAATSTIPIIFGIGENPVSLGSFILNLPLAYITRSPRRRGGQRHRHVERLREE
jgi:putative tryptophan/tyrosine transport system substrate-binding protein